MGGAAAAAAGAANARARRRVVGYFESRHATSPDSAIPFDSEGRVEDRWFDRLREAGAIAPATNGGYYLDAAKLALWQDRMRARAKRVMIFVLVVLVVVAVAAFLLGKGQG